MNISRGGSNEICIQSCCKAFGADLVLDDVSLEIAASKVTAIVGPNGVGKTTLFNIIVGTEKLDSGAVFLSGQPVHGLECDQISRLGVRRLPQDSPVFENLTAMDNVLAGCRLGLSESVIGALFWPFVGGVQEKTNRDNAQRLLEMVGLGSHSDVIAGSLSMGQRKLVALCTVLNNPIRCLFLDEPFDGLSATSTILVSKLLNSLKNKGVAIAIIDHDMARVQQFADEINHLQDGRVKTMNRLGPDIETSASSCSSAKPSKEPG